MLTKTFTYTFRVHGNLSPWIYVDLLSCEGQLPAGAPPPMRHFKREFFLDCCLIWGPAPGFHKASAKLNWFASDFTLLCCSEYFITVLLEYHVKPSPHCPVWPWLTQILPIEPENTLRQQRTAADTLCIDCVCLLFQIPTYRVSTEREEGGTLQRESSCSPLQKDTFHNENILVLIPGLNGSIDLIGPSLHCVSQEP